MLHQCHAVGNRPTVRQPPRPVQSRASRGRLPWRIILLRWRLRLWGLWVTHTQRGAHPIAELVARGEWTALDRLCDVLDADEHAEA